MVLISPASVFSQFDDEVLEKGIPTFVRTDLGIQGYMASLPTCMVHSEDSKAVFELKAKASALLEEAAALMKDLGENDPEAAAIIQEKVTALQGVMNSYDFAQIEPIVDELQTALQAARKEKE